MQEAARIRDDVEDRSVREKAVRRDYDDSDVRAAIGRKVRDRKNAAIRRQQVDHQGVKVLKPQCVDGAFLIRGEHCRRALAFHMVAPQATDIFV
jgi:hypothetical protein